jgi:hypothetical protein
VLDFVKTIHLTRAARCARDGWSQPPEEAAHDPNVTEHPMIHDVRVALPALRMLYGDKFAHDLAEELLLQAVVTIEKTGGKARARATQRAVGKALAASH